MFRRKGRGTAMAGVLNVLGLTVAFAAFYIMMVQVHHDFAYNRGIKDGDRVFVVSMPDWYSEGRWMTWMSRPPMEKAISECSLIECGGTGYLAGGTAKVALFSDGDGADHELGSTYLSEFTMGALETFGVEVVEGQMSDLESRTGYAISESLSKQTGLGVGQTFTWGFSSLDARVDNTGSNKNYGAVTCVYKDFPSNSDLSGIGMFTDMGDRSIDDFSEWSYPYFVKLHSAQDKEEVEAQIWDVMRQLLMEDMDEGSSDQEIEETVGRFKVRLTSLRDIYYDSVVSSPGRQGSKTSTMTLLAIAILVMLIAFINFFNFSFAMVPLRIKSLNMRKILGSSRGSLIWGSMAESLVTVSGCLVLAFVIVWLFQGSIYANLITADTAFGSNVLVLAVTVCLGLALAVLSSLYPSVYATSFSPAFAVKGSFSATAKGRGLRTALIGLQFVISIGLIVCAMFINMQRGWMMRHDMGFDKENLLVCETSYAVAQTRSSVTDELRQNPQIADVTWANGPLVEDSRMGWGRIVKGRQINYQVYPVDWNFLRFMGIDIVEGRDFTQADEQCENGVYIFNEAAKKQFEIALNEKMEGHRDEEHPAEVVGFCKDFNFASLRNAVEPFCFYIFGKNGWGKSFSTLYVRTTSGADIPSVMSGIRKAVMEADPSLTEGQVDVKFFDETLQSQYSEEKRLSSMITLFTVLAILISLMGIFGLVLFETEFRRKEIGVRRVNGATVEEILAMFNSKFVRIVLVCFVVAAPLSYFIMDRYLQGFAYRMPLYVWVFAVALLAVLAVTVAVVTFRSLRAATENPVSSLRSE